LNIREGNLGRFPLTSA